MFVRLLLLFTVVPLIELFLLLVIGRLIGAIATIALVIVTGVLGAWLAKSQGLKTWGRVRSALQAGSLPTEALLDGLLIFIAGAVLLTPGILTDLIGFVLLTPAGRRVVRQAVAQRMRRFTERGDSRVIVIDDYQA